jgi:hypothetical protein
VEYADVRNRIHGLVDCLIDRGSTLAVVSKGDPELVGLGSSQGWHFPQTADGKYSGQHPANGAEAIAHLEQLRQQGADYFLLPSTYFWWLEHYDELARHLRSRYRLVADCPDTCLIYDLRAEAVASMASVEKARGGGQRTTNSRQSRDPLAPAIQALLDSLLPEREPVLVVNEGRDELLRLGRTALAFPHEGRGEDQSIGSTGVRYLVVPEGARQDIEHSGMLRDRTRELAFRDGICTLYELKDATPTRLGNATTRRARLIRRLVGGRSGG